MKKKNLDVVGIGNAIVDVLSEATEDFLVQRSLVKGTMKLIGASEAEMLYDAMGPGIEASGGSAANTIAGLASLGGKGAFIGKVRNDQLGGIFRHDIRALGVVFDTLPMTQGAPTARCLILVTPDGQRTMQTFLGACVELGPEDVDAELIARSHITYLEGYLWDPPQAKQAFVKAAKLAHDSRGKVALSLSDPFCVDRHRTEFVELVKNHVDILFANEAEITSLYKASNFDEALQHVRGHCEIAVLTRSEKGAVVLSGEEIHVVDAEKVSRVIDTTGAGDLYAAGVLHGLARGRDLHSCGRLGAIAAAEVISHFGARPATNLAKLAAQKLGH